MGQAISHIQKRLALVAFISFALTPICGYAIAAFFGMVEFKDLLQANTGLPLLAIYAILLTWVGWHFYDFTRPLIDWHAEHHAGQPLPDNLNRHLRSFTTRYWSFYLIAILLLPTVQFWTTDKVSNPAETASLLEFMLMNLVIAIYVGMPGYLYCLNLLGHLNRYIGMNSVHITIQTKILLIGGFLPLLTSVVLLKYYWWRTGYLTNEVLVAWALIGFIAFLITGVAIHGLHQSLSPVKRVISRSGASSNSTIAKLLRPQSLDEIGYLVQMLGNVFKRLVEQESHVSAIVDHAAEGIIVLNDEQSIDTFNPAAERLFGYTHHEIRGKPIRWLIPELDSVSLESTDPNNEQELIGRNRNGSSVPIRVRTSQMQRDDEIYYTLIVADISEQQAAQKLLLEAESRYRNLVETAHDLVWSIDTQGRWIYLNNAVTEIYGYTQEEMLGQSLFQIQVRESKQRDDTAFAQLLAGKDLVQYETVLL